MSSNVTLKINITYDVNIKTNHKMIKTHNNMFDWSTTFPKNKGQETLSKI